MLETLLVISRRVDELVYMTKCRMLFRNLGFFDWFMMLNWQPGDVFNGLVDSAMAVDQPDFR